MDARQRHLETIASLEARIERAYTEIDGFRAQLDALHDERMALDDEEQRCWHASVRARRWPLLRGVRDRRLTSAQGVREEKLDAIAGCEQTLRALIERAREREHLLVDERLTYDTLLARQRAHQGRAAHGLAGQLLLAR